MDQPNFSLNPANSIVPRYSQLPLHQHQHQHQHQQHQPAHPANNSFYPLQRSSIDVDALAAGVQRYIPGRPSTGYPHNNSYISLPPGVDPATVDFRTFYPYNPSEVKHRKRTTRPQLKVLEETFKRETKPNAALRKSLAAKLEMTPRGVQVWFQNRRAKEKTLAKKASSSSASGRKSISLDIQNGDDADGDVDRDDGDVAADDDNANCEQLAHPTRQAPGTACALDERGRSLSSSNSPESTSPELTPPSASVDIPPHVNISPPADDDGAMTLPEAKQGAPELGFPPTAWHGPQRSMSRTPTLGMGVEQGLEYAGEMGGGGNGLHMMPMQDQFMRRPSLPTHLGIGPSRVRSGYHGSPRAQGMALGGVNAGRMAGFDPITRRMSLDRLANHPYAHIAAQANSAVYGAGVTRFRPSLPATTHSTPTLTPQARTVELPPIQPPNNDGGNSNSDGNPNSGMAELSLPPHLQHPPLTPPVPELRPELMHRQSLPAHLALPEHFPSSAGFAPQSQSQPQSATAHMPMRFPRPGHVYALSARSYQPPIPGPLPNPDFSFGSVGNGEGEGGQADSSSTPDSQLQATLNNFQFPSMDDGKDDGSAAGASNGLDMDMEGDQRATLPPGGLGARSAVYYRDTQGLHGAADPFASRFGSIASIASIAESESSATSGGYFSSEAGSNFDAQQDTISSTGHSSGGFNDARRTSCTGSMMDMFSNLEMQNGSQSSLPHPHDTQKQDPHQSQVPISRSSELALALMPDNDKSSSAYGGDNGSNINVNMSDASDAGPYNRASMSSSDLSHGHRHRHPLAMSSRSAGSSRSSLGIASAQPPRLPRIETDKLDFLHNYDAVSETGHYSPVSHPNSGAFDFPVGEPAGNGMGPAASMNGAHSNNSVANRDDMEQDGGMMSRTLPHQYGVDESCHGGQQQQQQSRFYSVPGPFSKDGSFAQTHQPSSYPLHSHSQENVAPYGYYT